MYVYVNIYTHLVCIIEGTCTLHLPYFFPTNLTQLMFHPLPMYLAGTWLIFPWLFRQKSPKVLASLSYLQYLGKYPAFLFLSFAQQFVPCTQRLTTYVTVCMHARIDRDGKDRNK